MKEEKRAGEGWIPYPAELVLVLGKNFFKMFFNIKKIKNNIYNRSFK